MLPALKFDRNIARRTTFRLLTFLTIVLAPIGIIAVFQTQALNTELREQAQATRLAAVMESVQQSRIVLDEAIGAAKALSLITDPSNPLCSEIFQRLVRESDIYSFAGVIPQDRQVVCSSADGPVDLSDSEVVNAAFTEGRAFADAVPFGRISGQPVIVMGAPLPTENGEVEAFTTVSVPQSLFVPQDRSNLDPIFADASALVLFNSRGEVLTALKGLDTAADRLPRDRALSLLAVDKPAIFSGAAGSGEDRIFTVVPVYEDIIYVLASWPQDEFWGAIDRGVPAWLFPIFMWLATLAVSYVAINRLVLRHVKFLGLKMRRFALNRSLPDLGPKAGQPAEIMEMDLNFRTMAKSILRDEAELEAALFEKNVLLREVHHRVKNNLQLIASIMNMQIRKSRNSETGTILRRLQDRVLSLAAVHQKIYQAETLSKISMPDLLDDIMTKTFRVAMPETVDVDVRREFDDIALHPDQAVPLALLLAEASTNAVKYMGTDEAGRGHAIVKLKREGSDALFSFENSKGERLAIFEEDRKTQTLGTQLINAFAVQLGGEIEVDDTPDRYRLKLSFPIADYAGDFAPTESSPQYAPAAQ